MNLKQAARTLGIHYQTAYKLVRSGRLAAVRVGGVYEVSEAAIERYLAEREALRAAPVHPPEPVEGIDDPFAAASIALQWTRTTARPVMEIAAESLASLLGDLAVVRPVSPDRRFLLPGVVRHRDPRLHSLAASFLDGHRQPVAGTFAARAVVGRTPVLVPHVPQDVLRGMLADSMRQYLDVGGVHSLVSCPAASGDEVHAVVTVTRDAPGRPYGREDCALVSRFAAIVGAAFARARATSAAQRRLRALMHAIASRDGASRDGASRDGVSRDGAPPVANELDLLLADGPYAEIVCDGSGRVLTANDVAAALAGTAREALRGRELGSLAAPAEQARAARTLRRLLVGELTYIDAGRSILSPRGSHLRVAVHHGVVRNAATEPVALVTIAHRLAEPETTESGNGAVAHGTGEPNGAESGDATVDEAVEAVGPAT